MTSTTPNDLQGASAALKYLGLPGDYEPSPVANPIDFLSRHLQYLPPNILALFSPIVSPKQRTVIPAIRNRRLRYTESSPPELALPGARATWPTLWLGKITPEMNRVTAKEERRWADSEFLGGQGNQVGKLGELLGGIEEERAAERTRVLRREQRELEESLPEEDEDTDDEEYAEIVANEEIPPREAEALFLRRVRERLIYGSLDAIDYDKIDWDEKWEPNSDRDQEERWFDEEDEEESFASDEHES